MEVEARVLACMMWMSTSESIYRHSRGLQGQSTGFGANFRGPVSGSWDGGPRGFSLQIVNEHVSEHL